MKNTFLVVTSVACATHTGLRRLAQEAKAHDIPFILVGDAKSPKEVRLEGCDYYSLERQRHLPFSLARLLPAGHYARKNLGYLLAMQQGADCIIETDDDNLPLPGFWEERKREVTARIVDHQGWVNVYKYFSGRHCWPRGFALKQILDDLPAAGPEMKVNCPIQQGLADGDPDVDAIFRLTQPLPLHFRKESPIALSPGAVCPFNSQNTTWFCEAFPLLYLPSTCSFRMTDIWRSFVAQRIAREMNWPVLFHYPTLIQERNDHDLLRDFQQEMPGYVNTQSLVSLLERLPLKSGSLSPSGSLHRCYELLIREKLVEKEELALVESWISDIQRQDYSGYQKTT